MTHFEQKFCLGINHTSNFVDLRKKVALMLLFCSSGCVCMCENNEDSFRHYFWFQMGTAYRKEVADVSLEIHVQSEDLICIEYCKFLPHSHCNVVSYWASEHDLWLFSNNNTIASVKITRHAFIPLFIVVAVFSRAFSMILLHFDLRELWTHMLPHL